MKKKFKPAIDGLLYGLHDKSVRIQYLLGLIAVIAGFLLKLTYLEWTAFVLCIGLVLVAELLNTAIELVCNRITMSYENEIKVIKDLAAGAVLASAVTAAVTAFIIFLHHL